MVWVGTPLSSLYAWMAHSTWFFNRKRGIDRNAFSKFMEDEWQKRPTYGMIAYPEGTRNQTMEPLTLKTGVLHFAYEYKHPVQCVITAHKEKACNEKALSASRGQTLITCCSDLVDPNEHETLEEFVSTVREKFVGAWKLAYNANVDKDTSTYNPPMGATPPVFEPASEPYKLRAIRVTALLAFLALLGERFKT